MASFLHGLLAVFFFEMSLQLNSGAAPRRLDFARCTTIQHKASVFCVGEERVLSSLPRGSRCTGILRLGPPQ